MAGLLYVPLTRQVDDYRASDLILAAVAQTALLLAIGLPMRWQCCSIHNGSSKCHINILGYAPCHSSPSPRRTLADHPVTSCYVGSSISVYANATGGMGWYMEIDGQNRISSSSTFNSPLATWSGLDSGAHILTLYTVPGPSGSTFNLDRADLTIEAGVR
ncbi:hypothetical protein DL93DRAFT_1941903 [Clavulina sp. PMI_390]|nr:hypothetical protein DL93DRAFT_1941903 [Clavulina sp. PMI_390]